MMLWKWSWRLWEKECISKYIEYSEACLSTAENIGINKAITDSAMPK